MADENDIEGSDLAALVASEIRSARRYADEELADKRARNLEYYNGELNDVPAPANRSALVSNDVRDTMSWMLPGIIRVFTASDQMVIYEPTTERDRDFSQQATDYVNYVFFKYNEGYRTLYNSTHDSLLGGNGIICHYWDPTPKVEISKHSRLTPIAISQLLEDEGVEILAQQQNEEPDTVTMPDPATGQPVEMQMPTFDLKVQRTVNRGSLKVWAGKPENFFLDAAAATIDEARFQAYLHDDKTRSDLMEMADTYGWEAEDIEMLPADNLSMSSEEGLARERQMATFRTDTLKSTQLIDLYECYLKADVDGDGIAETVQVWYAGNAGSGKVLGWDVWEDETPFSDIPCYPVPHRWDADSVADRTYDIMKAKTVVLRGLMDNVYAAAGPMREVDAGSVLNPDILVAPKFQGIIWKKAGSAPIVNYQPPFVGDKLYGALEYLDQVRGQRTGVTRTTMALDPETLQNQTATANQNQHDAGYSQIELVARNMAELGWTRVFRAMLSLVVKHQDRPRTIRLRDKFVEMDPRQWNAGMDVTINVGLGTGSRDRDMMMLQSVKQDQLLLATQFADRGAVDKAIDMVPRILLTMKKTAESAGLKNPDAFYPEFNEQDVDAMKATAAEAAQQPSPQEKIEAAKIQATQQAEQLKAEGNIVKEKAQLEADLQLNQAKLQNDMMLEAERIASAERIKAAELEFQREQLAVTVQLEREKMAHAASIAAMKPNSQPSGKSA